MKLYSVEPLGLVSLCALMALGEAYLQATLNAAHAILHCLS